ncbi:MAG: stage III sporulation protein AB [Lachnospiraceae bacterium]|nr:stage III sporulation protein AB [Lachnospiraceae bacterium]
MLKLAGIILLMMGCIGLGINRVSDEKTRIIELRQIRRMILRMQNEMQYGKRTLPEICMIMGQCMEEPFKEAFNDIFKRLEENDGSMLDNIWKERLVECMKTMPLKEEEKAVLIEIPEQLGILDETTQAQNIGQSLDMIEERIHRTESEYESKSKVIMSISVMAGLFLTIILL